MQIYEDTKRAKNSNIWRCEVHKECKAIAKKCEDTKREKNGKMRSALRNFFNGYEKVLKTGPDKEERLPKKSTIEIIYEI